jgi:hypothetical protein
MVGTEMTKGRDKAAKYQHRAEELRCLAQEWLDSRAKSIILQLADDYDRMAETVSNIRLVDWHSAE